MLAETFWVKSVPVVTGQDHLGTIAPGESIYAEQIPGITNVTSRARYYSFYPWFFRELGRRAPTATGDDLLDALRRAECLFALIAIRHARLLGDDEARHGATMVGREKLVPAVDGADARSGTVHLAEHADREGTQRYFMNPLGGLGQYYFGALRELGILGGDTRTRDIRYTEERGLPIAQAFGGASGAERFFELLRQDVVEVGDLDALAAFCPCGLAVAKGERRALINLMLDPTATLGDEARARRATIALVLDLASREAAPEYDFSSEFRASTYSGALLDGSLWAPPQLAASTHAWASYGRHELLSLAFQGLFWAALTASEAAGRRSFRDAGELASFAAGELVVTLPAPERSMTYSQYCTSRSIPPMTAWADASHEMKAAWRILERKASPLTVASDALHVLAVLTTRASGEDPYARLHFEADYFDRYPINLRSFVYRAKNDWAPASMEDVLRLAVAWALRTHWRVALQKLAESSARDTFKVRPLEGSVLIVEAPPPMFSVPRIHRVVGILRDLGLLEDDSNNRPVLTQDGKKLRGDLLG